MAGNKGDLESHQTHSLPPPPSLPSLGRALTLNWVYRQYCPVPSTLEGWNGVGSGCVLPVILLLPNLDHTFLAACSEQMAPQPGAPHPEAPHPDAPHPVAQHTKPLLPHPLPRTSPATDQLNWYRRTCNQTQHNQSKSDNHKFSSFSIFFFRKDTFTSCLIRITYNTQFQFCSQCKAF